MQPMEPPSSSKPGLALTKAAALSSGSTRAPALTIELPPPYQIQTVLHGRSLTIQVRDHRLSEDDEIVFDFQAYDEDEDCLFTPTPEQARAIWNILMADLETICQSSVPHDDTGKSSSS